MAHTKNMGYFNPLYCGHWCHYVTCGASLSVLRDQFTNLAQEFPEYFMAFTQNIVEFLNHSRFNEYLDKISFNFDEVLNNFTTDMVKQ